MAESRWLRWALIGLLLIYAVARVLQIFPTRIPALPIVLLHVVPPACFAWLHGGRRYGVRGILVFTALSLGVGSFFESLSLRTGFPFGHYVFTNLMGPKIAGLPVLLALAYVGVGYLAWEIACRIVTAGTMGSGRNSYMRLLLTPLVACAAMTAWDISMDPVWANIDRAWIWRDGGGYFGVPVSNFLGWTMTTWVFYQLFALWLRGRETEGASRGGDRLAIAMYGEVAAGNLLLAIPSATPAGLHARIVDAAGRAWPVSDVVLACALMSLLVMLPLTAVAWGARSTRGAWLCRE